MQARWCHDNVHSRLISGLPVQDIRTWSVVWKSIRGAQRSAAATCRAHPTPSQSAAQRTASQSNGTSDDSHTKAAHVLHEAPSISERHLLCVAASVDGSAIAAAGVRMTACPCLTVTRQLQLCALRNSAPPYDHAPFVRDSLSAWHLSLSTICSIIQMVRQKAQCLQSAANLSC